MTLEEQVESLREIAIGAKSFPGMRRDVSAWRESRDAGALVSAASGVLEAHHVGDEDERLVMAGALLLAPALSMPRARELLLEGFADVDNWRVQECVAKAMDEYASLEGWKRSLDWLRGCVEHPHANVRRAAIEGPRVWTTRPPFKGAGGADAALSVFDGRRTDESSYVRKSVGNAMRDIGKRQPKILLERIVRWSADGDVHPEVARLALRQLKQAGDPTALDVLDSLSGRKKK